MPTAWGKTVYYFSKYLVLAIAGPMFKLKVQGSAKVPRRGPVLLASNHVSHLDPPLLGISCPRLVRHMAKKELFGVGLLRWYMTNIGTILVDRGSGRQALLDAVAALKAGDCVAIFPEGTRSVSGVMQQGRSGAVIIAIQSGCPIMPVGIIGSEKAMTKGSKKIKSVPVTLRYGEPYTIDYSGDRENIPKEVIRHETLVLMERIEALLPEHMRPSAEDKRAWYKAASENVAS
ncbi:1-acyl-sn-glycerol-3-phosphate acyltransferase [bacterium]|nr:1-acyl-sn-glycerol-3-phosphate acyltransferase [bacterium]